MSAWQKFVYYLGMVSSVIQIFTFITGIATISALLSLGHFDLSSMFSSLARLLSQPLTALLFLGFSSIYFLLSCTTVYFLLKISDKIEDSASIHFALGTVAVFTFITGIATISALLSLERLEISSMISSFTRLSSQLLIALFGIFSFSIIYILLPCIPVYFWVRIWDKLKIPDILGYILGYAILFLSYFLLIKCDLMSLLPFLER